MKYDLARKIYSTYNVGEFIFSKGLQPEKHASLGDMSNERCDGSAEDTIQFTS